MFNTQSRLCKIIIQLQTGLEITLISKSILSVLLKKKVADKIYYVFMIQIPFLIIY